MPGIERIDDPPGETSAFFRAGDGVAGHTQVLVVFDRTAEGYVPPDPDRTTVDHVSFGIRREAFDADTVVRNDVPSITRPGSVIADKRLRTTVEAERLEGLGYDLDYAYHDWVEWRSLYLPDQDGNSVELVCFDPE